MTVDEKTPSQKNFSPAVWKKIWPFISPVKKYLIAVLILMMITASIDISFPLFQKYAIDNFITKMQSNGIVGFTVLYFLVLAFQTVLVVIFSRFSMVAEMNIGKVLKRATFVHLQKLSFSYYNQTPVGYILARVMSDTNRIGGVVAWGLTDIVWALFYVIGVFISMVLLDFKLALLVITVVPFIAVITVYFQNKILKLNREIRKVNSEMTGDFNEGIVGARTSKTLVIEEKNLSEFSQVTSKMYRKTIQSTMLNAMYIPIVTFFSSVAVVFVLTKGGYMVMDNALQLGTLSAFISYALGIFDPIQQIARGLADFVATQANIERVTDLLETEPIIKDTPEVIEKYGDTLSPKRENWEKINGEIEFKHVWFKYPDGGDYVLEDFNLKIPAGTTVAIVGETGAGKSTLVNLACRFFEPTRGEILIDGKDYRERSQLWLHSNIGYVLQNPHLFSGTVKENIRYGNLNATDEDIRHAAELVSADKVINSMENGYDSDVGEGGDRLSTGEKQLISFARAVLADPRIFVLDEATSSIDTQTEELIQHAISHLLNNRTSFLIAHRLSTIRKADIILVVRAGKIIEQGTHKELLRAKGHYYSLYRKQFDQEAGESVFSASEKSK